MIAKLNSFSIIGINAKKIIVEVAVQRGFPSFNIAGLPDNAVKESKLRVIAALKSNGFQIPGGRITVNLLPGHIKKTGSHYDLPIALGLLKASNQLHIDLENMFFAGEISLEGKLTKIKSVFPMALELPENSIFAIPTDNLSEIETIKNLNIIHSENLKQMIEKITNKEIIITKGRYRKKKQKEEKLLFEQVKGQYTAKRAFLIAASGFHNLLMIGPPGSGKTMLAKRIISIMPELDHQEMLETSKIYSVCGFLDSGLIKKRPFREVHHTISDVGLVGGGRDPHPGEISLAHNGVLFLDELPEFKRSVLEVLRQPMENSQIIISRAHYKEKYPAKFLLIAAMNPCPCGYLTHKNKKCRCSYNAIAQYLSKLSGPFLDRIDIQIEVQPAVDELFSKNKNNQYTTKNLQKKVKNAIKIQKQRFKKEKIKFNALMQPQHIEKFCSLDNSANTLLNRAIKLYDFSARAIHKILKISRTIADIEESDLIKDTHISEALNYRVLDKKLFLK